MPLIGFDALFQILDKAPPRVGVAVAGGADVTVLLALRQATDRGWVRPLLFGDAQAMRALGEVHGISLEGMTVIDSETPASDAVAAIHDRRAELLMKGRIATPDLMRAVLDAKQGLRTERTICQVVLMEIAEKGKRFLLADTGITPRPTLTQKMCILRSALRVARSLGEKASLVAVMSASEKVTDALPDTHEAAELQKLGEAGEFGRARVQGPLSFDLAYAPEAGERKGVDGSVTGAADLMLFPDLTSANLTVKAIMYTANCRFGGVLCGASVPVVFMSRADSTETRLHSLSLALGVAEESP